MNNRIRMKIGGGYQVADAKLTSVQNHIKKTPAGAGVFFISTNKK